MAENVLKSTIQDGRTLYSKTSDATAVASDILTNKTAYVDGEKITGTMPDRSTVGKGSVFGLDSADNADVPCIYPKEVKGFYNTADGNNRLCVSLHEGYYSGDSHIGIYNGNFGTATTSNVLEGKTFTSQNGLKLTGTIKDRNTVGTNSVIGLDSVDNAAIGMMPSIDGLAVYTNSDSSKRLCFRPKAGYYNGSSYTGMQLSNLGNASASNVLSGKTFTSTAGLKVTGTMKSCMPTISAGDNNVITYNQTFSESAGYGARSFDEVVTRLKFMSHSDGSLKIDLSVSDSNNMSCHGTSYNGWEIYEMTSQEPIATWYSTSGNTQLTINVKRGYTYYVKSRFYKDYAVSDSYCPKVTFTLNKILYNVGSSESLDYIEELDLGDTEDAIFTSFGITTKIMSSSSSTMTVSDLDFTPRYGAFFITSQDATLGIDSFFVSGTNYNSSVFKRMYINGNYNVIGSVSGTVTTSENSIKFAATSSTNGYFKSDITYTIIYWK